MSFDPSRRTLLAGAAALAAGAALPLPLRRALAASAFALARPRPTSAQLRWQRDELALFVHFGINTFTDREWGDGKESPSLFNPESLDARQWAVAARAAGAKAMILTAKHHDGFCLWPTATTKHSVASSPWKNGHGDVVREFVDACRAEGMRPGLYCSPWDRNHPTYGDSPRYNDIYNAQLTELLTRYGQLAEVWFDGANGEGPNGKKQEYDWPRTWATVRTLQPNAVIFSDAGPDVRWIGNERGVAGETNWSTIRPESVPFIGASGDDVIKALQQGHADGSVWRPGETDVSIRPGWFHHPAEDTRVKTAEQLADLFFTSVGRNSKLLLNVPPTRTGQFHATDVERLAGMKTALAARFGAPVNGRTRWRKTGPTSAEVRIELSRATSVSLVDMREDVEKGQLVQSWELLAAPDATATPASIARGTTVGYRQLRRVTPTTGAVFTLRYDTLDTPRQLSVHLFT